MIAAIILNFRTPKKSIKCIKSLLPHSEVSKIILVNNDLKDKSVDLSRINSNKIIQLNTNKNLGYSRGNNFGYNYLIKNNINFKYILIINSDIFLHNKFKFKQLLHILEKDKKVGVVSPRIINTVTGKNQGPYFKDHVVIYFLESIFPPLYLFRKLVEKFRFRDSGYVYRTMGSFMIFKSETFSKIKMFDTNTFLGSEEEIISEKLKKINMCFYHYKDDFVFHNHGSSRKKISSELVQKTFLDSKLYYFKSYRNANNLEIKLITLSIKLKNFYNAIYDRYFNSHI